MPPRRAASVYPMPNIDMARYSHLFRYRDLPYSFEMLNDSTLYFGLSSFQLTKVQRDALRDSIAGYVDVPYMIMDLRDNPGGDAYFLSEMLTWFINSPTVPLGGYSHVKTRGPLMHSWNYAPDQIVFPEYVEVEGKPGYYLIPDDAGVLYPDSTLNYRGRLYILTDETSCSAATIFPSVLVRNRRAVTVGRETMSGYHYLTAMKYNEVRLPNSKIILHVPLVMEVFDEAVTPRTPAGRGLMPDYPVPIRGIFHCHGGFYPEPCSGADRAGTVPRAGLVCGAGCRVRHSRRHEDSLCRCGCHPACRCGARSVPQTQVSNISGNFLSLSQTKQVKQSKSGYYEKRDNKERRGSNGSAVGVRPSDRGRDGAALR